MSQRGKQVRRHIVIVGGGFGGLEAAKHLRKADVSVTLVDRHNYHLFQPLLYQVATGGLSPSNIATPLRSILSRQENCEVLLAEVTEIDLPNRRVIFADGELEFDDLVLAAGATHSYFGNDNWEQFAPGLKSIAEATEIRRRIFLAFEAAEREPDPKRREALMTFVVVGAGPTGVEMAGAIAEIARHTLKHDFRKINPEDAKILLVEMGQYVLPTYPPELCERAAEKVRSFGIEVHTETKVVEITADTVRLVKDREDTTINTQTVIWAAGVKANPLAKLIAEACNVELDRAGRIPVTPQLNVEGHDNIFVIGDMARCLKEDGDPLPGMAPVALQQGEYVAKRIAAQAGGRTFSEPFRYKDRGKMATIGRAAAVALIGKRQFCGLFAWFLWLAIHLMQIVRFQNRLLILCQWAYHYTTLSRSSRLITGNEQVRIVNQQSNEERTIDIDSPE